jgi:hypothetical protein
VNNLYADTHLVQDAIQEIFIPIWKYRNTIKGLNHLFQHCITCTMQEPFTLKEDFAAEVLQQMKEWLDKQTHNY